MRVGEILCDETGGHFVGGVGSFKNSTGPVLCGSRLPFLLEPPVAAKDFASRVSWQESVAARQEASAAQTAAVRLADCTAAWALSCDKHLVNVVFRFRSPDQAMSTRRKSGTKRRCYRNGVAAVEETFRASVLHGRRRTWHRNGRIATEEFYDQGLLHGLCRQWSESGKLLGTFRMRHGTGVQKSWHDNGRLNLELTTVNGQFCGRSRLWLRDGTLVSHDIFLNGRNVTAEQYRKAAAQDRRLPKLRGRSARVPANNRKTRQHIHRSFVSTLMRKPDRYEACAWLQPNGETRRSLGHFRHEADALSFVQRLYAAGAINVIAPDIYFSKAGDQFADSLLVRLPVEVRKRRAIRRVCASLRTAELGAVEPAKDIGESHLYLSMA